MKALQLIICGWLLIILAGCGGEEEAKNVPQYDIYWCSSVSVSSSSGTYMRSGIYGARRSNYAAEVKILDLNTSIDTCAVDKLGNIYWGDRDHQAIFKANKFGQNVQAIVTGLDIPLGLAIDEVNQRVYWSNWLQASSPQKGEIGYANLDGSNQNTIVTTGLNSGGAIVVDAENEHIYLSDSFGGKIVRTGLEGGALEVVTLSSFPVQFDIDFQGERLIWADLATDTINSVNLDGTNAHEIIAFNDPFANPEALSIDQTNHTLYFVDWDLTGSSYDGYQKLMLSDLEGNNITLVNSRVPVAAQALVTVQ